MLNYLSLIVESLKESGINFVNIDSAARFISDSYTIEKNDRSILISGYEPHTFIRKWRHSKEAYCFIAAPINCGGGAGLGKNVITTQPERRSYYEYAKECCPIPDEWNRNIKAPNLRIPDAIWAPYAFEALGRKKFDKIWTEKETFSRGVQDIHKYGILLRKDTDLFSYKFYNETEEEAASLRKESVIDDITAWVLSNMRARTSIVRLYDHLGNLSKAILEPSAWRKDANTLLENGKAYASNELFIYFDKQAYDEFLSKKVICTHTVSCKKMGQGSKPKYQRVSECYETYGKEIINELTKELGRTPRKKEIAAKMMQEHLYDINEGTVMKNFNPSIDIFNEANK